jgi:hypothetical protein
MHLEKIASELTQVSLSSGWVNPGRYPEGIEEKVLSGRLDPVRRLGFKTRLLRFAPGVVTIHPFVHDFWEEVFLFSGDLTVGVDSNGRGGETPRAPTYARRPPGVAHGPFRSDGGCILLELHYYP